MEKDVATHAVVLAWNPRDEAGLVGCVCGVCTELDMGWKRLSSSSMYEGKERKRNPLNGPNCISSSLLCGILI